MQDLPLEGSHIFELINLGHHVYLGNSRGTEYSQGHARLNMVDDAAEYWDFSYAELHLDVMAQGNAIMQNYG